MRYRNALSFISICISTFLLSPGTIAGDVVWRGDFESGDLSQWSFLLNPDGLAIEKECVASGRYAGRVTLTGDDVMLWQGNPALNRAEFSYTPEVGLTAEGQETFFGWSFYLEENLLPVNHEIGYWESDKSWQQMFRFVINGTRLAFQQSSREKPFWELNQGAAAGRWHHVAQHIFWSTDAEKGFVQAWINGTAMPREYFQTLPSKNAVMFVQLGLLRARQEQTETLLLDNVRLVNSLETLLASEQRLQSSCAAPKHLE